MDENQYRSVDNEIPLANPKADKREDTSYENSAPTWGEERENYKEVARDYSEETSVEIAPPPSRNVDADIAVDANNGPAGGTVIGTISLIVSILSLFTMPILLGILGIVGGFISRARGARSLGNWAIGIGAASIIVGMFILPFF